MASRTIHGRYRVEEEIGRGAMGSVYRVWDTATRRQLALKTLRRPDGSETRQIRAELWFRREFHVVAGLRHPCVVEVHDYGVDDEAPYYTMELLDGKDLREVEHQLTSRAAAGCCATWRLRSRSCTRGGWCTAISSRATCAARSAGARS